MIYYIESYCNTVALHICHTQNILSFKVLTGIWLLACSFLRCHIALGIELKVVRLCLHYKLHNH